MPINGRIFLKKGTGLRHSLSVSSQSENSIRDRTLVDLYRYIKEKETLIKWSKQVTVKSFMTNKLIHLGQV